MGNNQINKQVVVSSMFYSVLIGFLIKIIGLVISIVLARLLSPDDFGLVSIVMVFIEISQIIIKGGFKVALVQKKETTDTDYNTVFVINLIVSIILTAILFFVSPIISSFYDNDLLVIYLKAYSFSLLLAPFSICVSARMEKNMKFKQLLICNIISCIASGALGIIFALNGFGAWAIIIYYGSNSIISCVCMGIAQKWVPKLKYSHDSAKVLFGFGWKLLVASLLTSLYNNIRSIFIGKKFSTEDLAFYDRGQQIPYIITNTLDNSVQQVMLPTLSSVQDDKERLKDLLKKCIKMNCLIILPAMFGLLMIAEPLVRFLLTDKWIACVPFLQLMCIAWASTAYTSSHLVAIKALGKSDSYMKLEIVRRILMMIVLVISLVCFDSVLAIAVGFLISMLLDVVVIGIVINKLIHYSLLEMFKDTWKTLLSTLIMSAVIYVINLININYIILMFTEIIVGILVYLILCRLFKNDAYMLGKEELKKYLQKFKNKNNNDTLQNKEN